MKRTLAAAIVFSATPALADEVACETSADCGGSYCIDGVCSELANGKVSRARETSAGASAMIGDGHGYVVPIIVGDVIATAVTGLFVGLAFSVNGWFGLVALFPTTLTGPIIHAANGRAGPAVISFFAWASAPPTSVTLGFFVGYGSQTSILLGGTIVGVACAAGLTALDAFFARPVSVSARPSAFVVRPAIAPTRGGLSASLVGTF